MSPSGIQPVFWPSWSFIGRAKILHYDNYPDFTFIVTAYSFHMVQVELYDVTRIRWDFFYWEPFIYRDYSHQFYESNNIKSFVIAQTFHGLSDSRIQIERYDKNFYSVFALTGALNFDTLQNETVSKLMLNMDESITVMGKTWGNFLIPNSLTGLVDTAGLPYQSLFIMRLQTISIRNQVLEVIDIANDMIKVILVLDGVSQTDCPNVNASMADHTVSPHWLNATSLAINVTGAACGILF
ncbi:hypothetical protein BKA69DRAFT_1049683 [Paraphysoderma sedebokerense]|nr:hypothetical protein BKA69DRAFT_1049683 [Paraphysoderma sedebokerense]